MLKQGWMISLLLVVASGCGQVDDNDQIEGDTEAFSSRSSECPARIVDREACQQLALQDSDDARWQLVSLATLWPQEIDKRYIAGRWQDREIQFELDEAEELFTNARARYAVSGFEYRDRKDNLVGRAFVIEDAPVTYLKRKGSELPDGLRGYLAAVIYVGDTSARPSAKEPCQRVTTLRNLEPGSCYWVDGRDSNACFAK